MFLVPFATSAVERLVLVPRGWLFRVLLRLKVRMALMCLACSTGLGYFF